MAIPPSTAIAIAALLLLAYRLGQSMGTCFSSSRRPGRFLGVAGAGRLQAKCQESRACPSFPTPGGYGKLRTERKLKWTPKSWKGLEAWICTRSNIPIPPKTETCWNRKKSRSDTSSTVTPWA